MTPLTSSEKMRTYRAKLLPVAEYFGFRGRDGRPSISNFETTLANAFERGDEVTLIIGGVRYPPERVQPAPHEHESGGRVERWVDSANYDGCGDVGK